jgi:putative peptidoglycan lipid II flippase
VTLFYTLGFPGIAISTAIASWVTVAQMSTLLWREKAYRPSARATGKIIRVIAASVILGILLAVAAHFRHVLEAPLAGVGGAKEITVLAVSMVGGLIYPLVLFALGGVTPAEVRGALKRRKGDVAVAVPEL